MGTIQIQNLNFKYSNMSQNLFENIDIQIDETWKLGLIGRNGRGKTTLLKIIQNQLSYDGKILTNLNFSYFPKDIKNQTRKVEEIIFEISSIEEYDLWKIQIEFEKLNLDNEILKEPYNILSPGQQTKVQLAAMFVNEREFQLLDEPTNHLDIKGRQIVQKYLKSKKGFIVVSHDRVFLNNVVDHVISIDRSNISVYKGNFDTWEIEKNKQDKHELQQKEQLQSEIKKMKLSATKKENWSKQKESDKYKKQGMENAKLDKGFIGSRAARVMKRAKQIENRANNAINEKESLLKNIEIDEPLSFNYLNDVHFKEIITAENLQMGFNGNVINQPISFNLELGKIFTFIGENGVGKSTLIKSILNKSNAKLTGELKVKSNLKISYLSQNANELNGTIEELSQEKNISKNEIFSNLRKLGFERSLFNSKIESMSQGQKKKVALALSLLEPANIYIWDEPLNYLDVITRSQIIEAIKKYHPTMLVIEHDQDFINGISDKKIIFESTTTIESDQKTC